MELTPPLPISNTRLNLPIILEGFQKIIVSYSFGYFDILKRKPISKLFYSIHTLVLNLGFYLNIFLEEFSTILKIVNFKCFNFGWTTRRIYHTWWKLQNSWDFFWYPMNKLTNVANFCWFKATEGCKAFTLLRCIDKYSFTLISFRFSVIFSLLDIWSWKLLKVQRKDYQKCEMKRKKSGLQMSPLEKERKQREVSSPASWSDGRGEILISSWSQSSDEREVSRTGRISPSRSSLWEVSRTSPPCISPPCTCRPCT